VTWRATRLKHLCQDAGQYGFNTPAESYTDAGLRLLRTSDIREDGTLSPPEEGIFVSTVTDTRFLLRTGDLLLSRSGTVGRGFLVPDLPAPSTFAGFLVRFRPLEDVEPRFLAYAAASQPFQDAVAADAVSSTILNFNAERYANIQMLAPRLDEQRRIADYLDAETARIDRLLQLRKRQMDLAAERHCTFWSELIVGVGPLEEWVPLRRLLTSICDGPFGSSLTSAHYEPEGARVVRLGNIGAAAFKEADVARIGLGYYAALIAHAVRARDVVMAGLGDQNNPLGRACVVPDDLGPAIVKADCFRLRFEHVVDPEYAACAISSPAVTAQTSELSRGSTRARINTEVAREIRIPVPSLDRQRMVSRAFTLSRDHQDRLLNLLTKQNDQLEERRVALITAAVTGQLDVTTASGVA
jgi:type I restriction enzyme S subunit